LPVAVAKIIATVVMARIRASPMTNGVSVLRTPSDETELAAVVVVDAAGRPDEVVSEGVTTGFLVGALAGAPYEGEVAITVSCFATVGSAPRSAAFALADSPDVEDPPVPVGRSPLLVGIVSTYWETDDAGPSSAAAGCGRPRTAPVQTRHQIPT
jgi:hypothetical protein